MAELTIRPEEIRDALTRFVSEYEPEGASREEVGTVIECGDGIAQVEGLPSAMANELLEFENGVRGLALNLNVREIGVVILGEFNEIEEGQQVRRTGEILSVPVGDSFLGRVVGPLGEPLDGKGPIEGTVLRPLETQAPSVVERQPVREPLQTGIKAIDAMTAIGRGQRELIIGDRQTGKSAIAIDAIINQKANWESGDVGARSLHLRRGGPEGLDHRVGAPDARGSGALEYTTIIAAPASDPAGYKYIAPYTGSAIGQHWMYQGKHALIIFDDLSKQAEAYRAISLLLRRPPGREAYPGDVFYLHSRLLERCAKLSDELGGGSMTGLPIIETKANDISAYIPTNVISITDGQIFLETDLFNAGVRPAINVGRSVSRVGGNAQIKAMKIGRGQPAARPVAVPRPGGVRRVRVRPGRGLPGPARPRRPTGRTAQAAAVLAVPGRRAGGLDLGGRQRLPGRRAGRGHQPVRDRVPGVPARGRTPASCRRSGSRSRCPRTPSPRSRTRSRSSARASRPATGELLSAEDEPAEPLEDEEPGDHRPAGAQPDEPRRSSPWQRSFAWSGGGFPRCSPSPRSPARRS